MKKLIEDKIKQIEEHIKKYDKIGWEEEKALSSIEVTLSESEYNLNEAIHRHLISNIMLVAFMNEDNTLHLLVNELLTYLTINTLKGGNE